MNIDKVQDYVFKLMENDKTGHGIDHIKRVIKMSLKFAEDEGADKDIVLLIALLHDVDDYKLFGFENQKELYNARRILNESLIPQDIQDIVLSDIRCIGYSKRLQGILPITLEGKIVSDADMCDCLGTKGIIRTLEYSLSHGGDFFDPTVFPIDDVNANNYIGRNADTSVCHMFEKILKLNSLMLTDAGRNEASQRYKFNIDFLYQLFYEEDCPEWTKYLDDYLDKNKIKYKK